jgi:hypothetical protein
VRGGEKIGFNVAVPVLPVFPVGDVNWFSPEPEKEAFAHTIETIQWTGYNSVMILAGARARLSMADTHAWVTREFRARQMPGGFLELLGDHRGNYTEQMAACGIVSEMLLQSVGGIARVFPAWPKDRDAAFERLLAEGGFEVSAEQRRGEVAAIRVGASFGGDFRFLAPWPRVRAAVNGRPANATAEANDVFSIATRPGDTVTLTRG